MHKFNKSFVFHFNILGLTSWIWTGPSIDEELKFESPWKWNSYEGFNPEHWHLPKRGNNCMQAYLSVWRQLILVDLTPGLVIKIMYYSPPTLTSVGHQWTTSTNTGCNQWLSSVKPTLRVAPTSRNRSPVTRTSERGCAISLLET